MANSWRSTGQEFHAEMILKMNQLILPLLQCLQIIDNSKKNESKSSSEEALPELVMQKLMENRKIVIFREFIVQFSNFPKMNLSPFPLMEIIRTVSNLSY